jgi:UDP-glucose:(heptosyl)LPS alpha-1,3-glucosyltransferase
MNLALIRRRFSSSGGAELYAQRLMSALTRAGHAVHLLTEGWEGAPEGVHVHPIRASQSRSQRAWAFALAVEREITNMPEADGMRVFDCVFSLERTLRQDVLRAGDGLHRVCLRRIRQFTPWWRRWLVGRGRYHRELLKLEAQTFHPDNTRFIIANSEMVRREIIEEYAFPAERILIVRNGINVERFQSGRREETRARLGLAPEDYVLLFAGSGWKRKGLQYLLQLMRGSTDPRLKLLVAGKGRKPWRAPSNVVFAGAMPDIENACAAADLFVFTPLYDPSANVVFEALAAGLPVVTSAFNGSSEMLDPGVNGTIIANPSDIGAISNAVQFWRARPGRLAPPPAHRLSLERNVAETVRILETASVKAHSNRPMNSASTHDPR